MADTSEPTVPAPTVQKQTPSPGPLTGAPMQHPQPSASPPLVNPTAGLVKVSKDGETQHVHPTTLNAHEQAGWRRS